MSAEPGSHDAEFVGITYAHDNATAQLHLLHAGVEQSILILSGIRHLRLNDFGLQNVVSRILVSTKHAFSVEEIREYVQWARSQHDFRSILDGAQLQDLVPAIATRKAILLVVEPSVGAELLCLCAGVQHQT
ncbi:hypothetical protein [Caballeronia arvi]|uniref:hypothetical protein n=1 Tax=Caballeronia arvi TaxID=1777135 RepID=UPI00077265AE|nr:hypothetical protein [Caballeronia arvi]